MKIRIVLAMLIVSIAPLLYGCGYNAMQANEEAVKRRGGTWNRHTSAVPT